MNVIKYKCLGKTAFIDADEVIYAHIDGSYLVWIDKHGNEHKSFVSYDKAEELCLNILEAKQSKKEEKYE